MKHNITFVVFTYNEERRIEYVLRCFANYGNILLMDDGSTDRTIEIAHQYGAKVVRREKCDYVEQEHILQQIYRNTEAEWIYWTFADELLTKTLLEKLVLISKGADFDLVKIYRKNCHYGYKNLNFDSGALSPRFFRKGFVDFSNNPIHGMGKYLGDSNRILKLPAKDEYAMYHFSTYDVHKFELAHSRYSDIDAEIKFRRGKKFNMLFLLLWPLRIFVRFYLVGGAWKHGAPGLIMVMQYCFFIFNMWSKLWELENEVNLTSIENNYDRMKEELLLDIERN